jgi:peptidoglycan biosynthesis protein MviN/MurJ (putative lipid II flippase)
MTPSFKEKLARVTSRSAVLVLATLAVSAVFKLSAFAREAFIAARFGLSAITDAYFGLQQLPLTLATYIFGAFAMAFAPAYANARRRSNSVEWMPGFILYASVAGGVLTAVMVAASPWLLNLFAPSAHEGAWKTLLILSVCFAPIFYIGTWAAMCTAGGNNLWAMTMQGLPYLVMTLALLAIYFVGALGNLTLPISMTVGFVLVGGFSLVCLLRAHPLTQSREVVLFPWRLPEFRAFLRQLGASSFENCGFAMNQLLLLYFLARAGTGAVSANNCAMRIGTLSYSLLAVPLLQLVQAKLCSNESQQSARVFRVWLWRVAAIVGVMGLGLYALRYPVVQVVYMRGKFTGTELSAVVAVLPPWIVYYVIMALNGMVARYLFVKSNGASYVRLMWIAYLSANLLRFFIAGRVSAAWMVWCSVIAEGCALAVSLWMCFAREKSTEPLAAIPEPQEAWQ